MNVVHAQYSATGYTVPVRVQIVEESLRAVLQCVSCNPPCVLRVLAQDFHVAFRSFGSRCDHSLSMVAILISLYLNDIEHYLMSNDANGIVCEANTEQVYSYIKLLILLFADDTVLFSNNKDELQHMLNLFEHSCDDWKLTVNISKTKILIFTSGRYAQNLHFLFKGTEIEK